MLLSRRYHRGYPILRMGVRRPVTRYLDRIDAGWRLGERLQDLRGADVVVLGLPRGGVPVAAGVAHALGAPLDVIIVRKLGVPRQPEFAMGALGEGGVRIINDEVVAMARVSPRELAAIEERERAELERRARRFRAGRQRVPIAERMVIVVDDGIATGASARAACRVARAQGAEIVILAVPVGHTDAITSLRDDADEVICLTQPRSLMAIGEWYEDFSQTSDEEVMNLLRDAADSWAASGAEPGVAGGGAGSEVAGEAAGPGIAGEAAGPEVTDAQGPGGTDVEGPDGSEAPGPGGTGDEAPGVTGAPRSGRTADPGRSPPGTPASDRDVLLHAGSVELAGHLAMPAQAAGLVLFVHGSGSSRHSPRNRLVAAALNNVGLGTLLFDLLTPAEELDRGNVFDIELLTMRLLEVTKQLDHPGIGICYFGASTGAAAALWAAAEPGSEVAAIVSRGGRPDLAAPRLPLVSAPTLLIVGGADQPVLDLNARAQRALRCESRLAVIPGATHLFEEPGALPAVAQLAQDWFTTHLSAVGGGPA
jgi:putative phosphoribosyl transferase